MFFFFFFSLFSFFWTLRGGGEECSAQHFSSAGAIIVRIAYGYEAQHKEDPMIGLAESAMRTFTRLRDPGRYLVDFIPLCTLECSRSLLLGIYPDMHPK